MNIDLSTATPASPERTLRLAEALQEVARALNLQTRHREALQSPAEADRLLQAVTMAVSRLDQLLTQTGAWLDQERRHGRIEVTGGPHAGNPDRAVVTARVGLDLARTHLADAVAALESVTSVTGILAGREDGDGG